MKKKRNPTYTVRQISWTRMKDWILYINPIWTPRSSQNMQWFQNSHFFLKYWKTLLTCGALCGHGSGGVYRSFSFSLDDTISSSVALPCGIPQGSILVTILFSLYMLPIGHIFRKYGKVLRGVRYAQVSVWYTLAWVGHGSVRFSTIRKKQQKLAYIHKTIFFPLYLERTPNDWNKRNTISCYKIKK